ncbi:MAG: hypothetical protein ACR2F9_08370 [Longimicrobiaceae bacterium]
MLGGARGLRLPEELHREIAREAAETGAGWSRAARELLREAIRARRVPGIGFAAGAEGRHATLAGTELEVWRVAAAAREGGAALKALRAEHPWLSDAQLRAAAGYAALYAHEIDVRIEEAAGRRPRWVQEELPLVTPG